VNCVIRLYSRPSLVTASRIGPRIAGLRPGPVLPHQVVDTAARP
jgi:hypothetical protein